MFMTLDGNEKLWHTQVLEGKGSSKGDTRALLSPSTYSSTEAKQGCRHFPALIRPIPRLRRLESGGSASGVGVATSIG